MTPPRQGTLPNVLPKLKAHEDAALLVAAAEYEVEVKKEQLEKRKEEMVKAMHKARVDRVVVRDEHNREHVFELEAGNIKIKHRSYQVVIEEKAEGSLQN